MGKWKLSIRLRMCLNRKVFPVGQSVVLALFDVKIAAQTSEWSSSVFLTF